MSPLSHDPNQLLWLSVIEQALKDAIKCAGRPLSASHLGAEAIEQRKAYMWFEDAGEDFRLACHFAGLDPDYVRDHALEKLHAIAKATAAANASKATPVEERELDLAA